MSSLGWVSLGEALSIACLSINDRSLAKQRIIDSLSAGAIAATGLSGDEQHIVVPSDHWARCSVDWTDSSLTLNKRATLPIAVAHDGVMNRPSLNPRAISFGSIDASGRPRVSKAIAIWSIRLSRENLQTCLRPTQTSVGGRPAEYNWALMKAHAFEMMEKNGVPSATNRRLPTQEDLIQSVLNFALQADQHPGHSSVKTKVSGWIREFLSKTKTGS